MAPNNGKKSMVKEKEAWYITMRILCPLGFQPLLS